VPNSALARELSLQLSAPITATSANLSGDSAVLVVDEIATQLGHDLDLILDSGRVHSLVPSTIIDVSVAPFRLVREGVIEKHTLQEIIGAIAT
jgi:L-threonylcarbamoyladenylate synthase